MKFFQSLRSLAHVLTLLSAQVASSICKLLSVAIVDTLENLSIGLETPEAAQAIVSTFEAVDQEVIWYGSYEYTLEGFRKSQFIHQGD